ncbi:MAG: amidohydrolase [Thermomicrobiales bacterium]
MPADLFFTNGAVLTMDDALPVAGAAAVVGDRIARVGSHADLKAEIGPGTRVIDLAGGALIPGYDDNHTHPIFFGRSLREINARPDRVSSITEIMAAWREAAAVAISGVNPWLLGRGYDDTRLAEQRHPTRHDLDPVSGGRPSLLSRTCGHIAVANTAALDLAGVTRNTPDPQGGLIDRDEHGEPTGVLRETAIELVRAFIPPASVAEIKRDLRAASAAFRRFGITSVGEAMLKTPDEFRAYQELARDGELGIRVYLMVMIDDMLDGFESLGMRTGWGDDWLRIGPAKLFQDGSGGGRTAAMFDHYPNQPDNFGISIWTQEELDAKFGRAHRLGFQLCAHAIGDRAITMILNAYEAALASDPRRDHRHRVEHCGMCTPEILDRMARHGFIGVPQPNFIYELGDSYLRNFTPEQLSLSYPGRTWFDRGIVAVGSSDVPVVGCDPFMGLRSAVTRLTRDGQTMGAEQGVTVMEALRMFTRNGAFASFQEDRKGRIAPGLLADLAVLDRDPRTVEPERLHELRCVASVIGGAM